MVRHYDRTSKLMIGAYASATSEGNTGVCSNSADKSSALTTGDWKTATAPTNIPATTAYYLTTNVSTSSTDRPSVTFYPYVSAAGYYDLYVLVPGCSAIGDCGTRTSVDIEVFPKQDGLGWTSTISERVQDDTRILVYSGPIDMSSGSFSPTVILALAEKPDTISGNSFTVVASAVELVLTGLVDANGSIVNSTSSGNTTVSDTTQTSSASLAMSYGVFEYVRSSSVVNATTARLSNSSETSLTHLGFALNSALNSSSSRSSFAVHAIASTGTTIYVGGNFSSSGNYSNVLAIDTSSNQTSSLPSQGLDDVVYSIATLGNNVYFGGIFRSTATSGGPALLYLARYDTGSKAWVSLAGGVDGPVTDLTVSSSTLIVTGNFSHVIAADGTTTQSGGYAVWDSSSSTWSTSGALFGNVSTAALNGASTYMAGKVYGTSSNPANGVAMLSTGSDGLAAISTLSDVNFGTTGSTSPTVTRKRSHKSTFTRTWLSRFTDAIAERTIQPRATAQAIPSQIAAAPAVLAGAFWQNGSQSVTIMGGNFSTGSGSSQISGLAFHSTSLYGPTPPVSGVVRALEVVGDRLYVGGSALSVSGAGSNLVVYDLARNSWTTSGIPTLNPSSGSTVSVNTVQQRLNSNTVVVGGNFATAGALNCAALCLWDSGSNQWMTPGSGLASGEVKAVDFAGDTYNSLVAAGSFVLSTGSAVYVAIYDFDNASWTALDGLPGPALAVAVDDRNISNIFAAGYSTSDSSAYLRQWNGQSWNAQNASLLSGSIVQQLAFVPISQEHTAVGSIETNRMLMVTGDLYLESSGNVTSALYDGSNWYPYLVGISSSGGLASASQLFWSESSIDFTIRHYLARGLVVLVAIAIATGLILLLILLFFLIAYCSRRHERKRETGNRETFEKEGSPVSSTNQEVFQNVQAALEQSLGGRAGAMGAAGAAAGVGVGVGAAAATSRDKAGRSDPSSFADVGEYVSDDSVGEGGEEVGDRYDDEDESDYEEGRETTMRFDFFGPELQQGEMSMRKGQKVVVLDDMQSDEWVYARDPETGREGVVPASYGECDTPASFPL